MDRTDGRPTPAAAQATSGAECKQEVAAARSAPATCRNCAATLVLPAMRFCPQCGQDTSARPPTVMEFLHQFGGETIGVQGRLWRTLRLLLLSPGSLTVEYWAGRKRRYVLPVRLYLGISLVALTLNGWLHRDELPTAAQIEMQRTRHRTAGVPAAPARPQISVGLEMDDDGKMVCSGLPAWVCTRIQARYGGDNATLAAELQRLQERFVSHWGSAMFLLMPAFAAWLALVFRNRRRRYAEHLVFAVHLHAFAYLLFGAASVLPAVLTAPGATLGLPVYAALATRRAYGGRWWSTVARLAALAVLYGATLLNSRTPSPGSRAESARGRSCMAM